MCSSDSRECGGGPPWRVKARTVAPTRAARHARLCLRERTPASVRRACVLHRVSSERACCTSVCHAARAAPRPFLFIHRRVLLICCLLFATSTCAAPRVLRPPRLLMRHHVHLVEPTALRKLDWEAWVADAPSSLAKQGVLIAALYSASESLSLLQARGAPAWGCAGAQCARAVDHGRVARPDVQLHPLSRIPLPGGGGAAHPRGELPRRRQRLRCGLGPKCDLMKAHAGLSMSCGP